MVKKLLKKATGNPLAMGIVILLVVGIIAVVLIPGLIESIGNAIFGQVSPCIETPYDSDCFCEEGEVKLPHNVAPAWFCEPAELTINPDSQVALVNFAQSHLTETVPECDTIQCTQGSIEAGVGQAGIWAWEQNDPNPFRRIASVECFDAANRSVWWDVDYYVDTGEIFQSSCGSFIEPPPAVDNPATLRPIKEETIGSFGTQLSTTFEFEADCTFNSTHEASVTYNISPEYLTGKTGTNEWVIWATTVDSDTTCELSNITTSGVTLSCSKNCDIDEGFSSSQLRTRAYGEFNDIGITLGIS